MSAFLDGLGKVFGKIADQVQGRVERSKNRKADLENERKILMEKEFSASASRRIIAINDELRKIDAILEASAKD